MQRLPRPSRGPNAMFAGRDRYDEAAQASSAEGARTLLSGFLALSVFLLVLALSVRQATQPTTAQRALAPGIASLTDIDLVLAESLPALKKEAETGSAPSYLLPGYPIDAYLSRDELRTLSEPEVRNLLLERSAAIVYQEGLPAFDRTGQQSFGLFSFEGTLDLLTGRLTDDTNVSATAVAMLLAVVTGALAAGVVARGRGYARLRALGAPIVVGALPGFLLFLGVRLLVGQPGGDDPFVRDVREILVTLTGIPIRNYLIVASLGAGLFALSPAMSMASRWLGERAGPGVEALDDLRDSADQPEPDTAGEI